MATVTEWTPFGVAFDITATAGTVTRTSATTFTVRINASWTVHWSGASTNYEMKASSGGGSVILNTFGEYNSSGSGSFTGSYSISGNGGATKSITVTFTNTGGVNAPDGESASKPVSLSVSVPAWTSYTVSYNANGGSGAPSSQTKWKDQALTLSSTKPTRTGYTFKGWGTSASDTTVDYAAGGTVKADTNKNLDLYAIWQENVLTVKMYSNYATSAFDGAENAVGANKNVLVKTQTFYYDNTYSNGLANYSNSSGAAYMKRIGYTATGYWNTKADGSGMSVDEDTEFATGQKYAEAFGLSLKTGNASITVYAQRRENTLTANYYSNYATSAFDGTINEVGADNNVIVRTYSWTYTSDALSSGLHNYSTEGDTTYLARTRYDAVGYWGTAPEVYTKDDEGDEDGIISNESGIAVSEDNSFASGQELAEAFGLTLEDGDKTINLYAQWILRASMVTVYDSDGNAHRGLCHIYTPNTNFLTSDREVFLDSDSKMFMTNDGGVKYAIITVYDEDGNARIVV